MLAVVDTALVAASYPPFSMKSTGIHGWPLVNLAGLGSCRPRRGHPDRTSAAPDRLDPHLHRVVDEHLARHGVLRDLGAAVRRPRHRGAGAARRLGRRRPRRADGAGAPDRRLPAGPRGHVPVGPVALGRPRGVGRDGAVRPRARPCRPERHQPQRGRDRCPAPRPADSQRRRHPDHADASGQRRRDAEAAPRSHRRGPPAAPGRHARGDRRRRSAPRADHRPGLQRRQAAVVVERAALRVVPGPRRLHRGGGVALPALRRRGDRQPGRGAGDRHGVRGGRLRRPGRAAESHRGGQDRRRVLVVAAGHRGRGAGVPAAATPGPPSRRPPGLREPGRAVRRARRLQRTDRAQPRGRRAVADDRGGRRRSGARTKGGRPSRG